MNENFLGKITCGDCLQLIPELEDNSIDLLVTSPPYNVDLGNNKVHKTPYDLYNDNRPHHEYIGWLTDVFAEVKSKMVSGGRVVINIGDGKNGAVPTHSDVIQFMTHELGYLPMTTIIWNKNTTPNRAAWGSYMSPSCPSFPSPIEFILVFAKDTPKKVGDKDKITVRKKDFIDNAYTLWKFAPEKKQKAMGHGSMFPPELPRRCIEMLTYEDDVVLDPFAGLGTTAIAAELTNRQHIGFELSKNYCELATTRLEEIS